MMSKRAFGQELMDDPLAPEVGVYRALGELEVINTWLGGFSTTGKGLRKLLPALPSRGVEVLDVGAGGSAMIQSPFDGVREVRITALDINEHVCRYRRVHHPRERVLCADALTFSPGESSFDIVHASLFLHHFRGKALRALVGKLVRAARVGVIINDLQRSVFAYAGILAITRLFSRSELVRHDAPLSVRRGFHRQELEDLCSSSGASSYTIEWSWAFRWLVILRK
jgi:2-polyprenyl-3-methyl-5-hydroxy-6-metoxy-1,4-benzoquinol methylase